MKMRGIVMCLLAVVTLLTLLRPAVPVPTAAAPAVPEEEGVYEEDFSAYTYKDYVVDAEWDVWANALQLALIDGTAQADPALAVDGSDNAIIVWQDSRNGDRDIYAQKLDPNGNRLWAADMRVNSDSEAAYQQYPAMAVDGTGNAVVVWQDGRNGDADIYAQRLDASGNRLWAGDVRVNSGSGTANEWNPAVAVDGTGNAVVVWKDERNDTGDIYAQKLDASGNKLWVGDVRVNSDNGTAEQDAPAVTIGGSGNAVVVWNGSADIYAQKLDASGNRLWAGDVRVNSDSGTANQ